MLYYEKTYTRENCLLSLQIFEEERIEGLPEILSGWPPHTDPAIRSATGGVCEIYYSSNRAFPILKEFIAEKIRENKSFVPEIMEWYDGALGPLEDSWAKSMPLGSRERLVGYYYLAVRASAGLDMSYFIPDIEGVSSKDKELAIGMRGRSGDFLERTGRVMELSLERLYPALGRYSKYISKGELESEAIPTMEELIERDRHYIFYNHRLYTKISLEDFAKGIGVEIRREKEPSGTLSEIRGQTAMKGIAAGKVRIITRKDELRGFIEGEILVAPMTTADYLPAMQKASAIITDEGGITCHAAIVAREIGKPCIIGTRFATKVLKTGDLVELDADKGIISITHSKQSPHSK